MINTQSGFNDAIARTIRSSLKFYIENNRFEAFEIWLAQHSAIYGSIIRDYDLFNKVVFTDLKIKPNDLRISKIQTLITRFFSL